VHAFRGCAKNQIRFEIQMKNLSKTATKERAKKIKLAKSLCNCEK
jgi:hypothetical protein